MSINKQLHIVIYSYDLYFIFVINGDKRLINEIYSTEIDMFHLP